MIILQCLFYFWLLLNTVSTFIIVIVSISNADKNPYNALFFPVLVEALREELSILGTIIATTFITLFFAPALALYFIVLSVLVTVALIIKGFVLLFKRKD